MSSRCTLCALHQGPYSVCVPGDGYSGPGGVLFVGEAPGQNEDRQNRPFVGDAGKLLKEAIAAQGWNMAEVRFSNAVRCRPPQNRAPEKPEIKACSVHLDREIVEVRPRLIVVLGNTPLQAVAGKSGITKYSGQVLPSRFENWGELASMLVGSEKGETPLIEPAAFSYLLHQHRKRPLTMKELERLHPMDAELAPLVLTALVAEAATEPIPCVPVLHPAYVLRYPQQKPAFEAGLQAALKAACQEAGDLAVDTRDYRVPDTIEGMEAELKALLEYAQGGGTFAFDIETNDVIGGDNGPSAFREDSRIISIAFSTAPGEGFCVPLDHRGYDWREAEEPGYRPSFPARRLRIWKLVRQVLATDCPKVAHNAKFELQYLARFDTPIGGTLHDTLVLSHLLNEEPGNHALGKLAVRYPDLGQYKADIRKAMTGDTYETAPYQVLAEYNITDADATLRLFYDLSKEVQEQKGLWGFYNRISLPAVRTLHGMEFRGLQVDKAVVQAIHEEMSVQEQALDTALRSYSEVRELETVMPYADAIEKLEKAGKPVPEDLSTLKVKPMRFNFGSPDQLRTLLYSEAGFGLPILDYTKSTKRGENPTPSTDKNVLRDLAQQHEFPAKLLEYRKVSKLLTTYIRPTLAGDNIGYDGRMHTNYGLTGTVTGRLMCVAGDTLLETDQGSFAISDARLPNLQNPRILSHTGRWCRIVRRFYKGLEEMFDVTLTTGETIRTTRQHRFLTPNGWRHLADLRVGDTLVRHNLDQSDGRTFQTSLGRTFLPFGEGPFTGASQAPFQGARSRLPAFHAPLSGDPTGPVPGTGDLRRVPLCPASDETGQGAHKGVVREDIGRELGQADGQLQIRDTAWGVSGQLSGVGEGLPGPSKGQEAFQLCSGRKGQRPGDEGTSFRSPGAGSTSGVDCTGLVRSPDCGAVGGDGLHPSTEPQILRTFGVTVAPQASTSGRGDDSLVREPGARLPGSNGEDLHGAGSLRAKALPGVCPPERGTVGGAGLGQLPTLSTGGGEVPEDAYLLVPQSWRVETIGTSSDGWGAPSTASPHSGDTVHGGLLFPGGEAGRGSGRDTASSSAISGTGQGEGSCIDGIGLESASVRCPGGIEEHGRGAFEGSEGFGLGTVASIVPAGIEGVWDIEVEGDHSYVAQGFVNHNSANPNLQNMPKNDRLLEMFIPSRPGWVFVQGDFSQIELRLLAIFSGDVNMIEAYVNGVDIHARAGATLAGIPVEELLAMLDGPKKLAKRLEAGERVSEEEQTLIKQRAAWAKEWRSKGKTLNFTISYGGKEDRIATAFGVPREKGKEFIATYFRNPDGFWGLERYIRSVEERIRRNQVVASPLGRKRRLPGVKSGDKGVQAEALRQGLNFIPQSTASDLCLYALCQIDKALVEADLEARPVLTIHDSLTFECPEHEVEAVAYLAKHFMEHLPFRFLQESPVPIEVDFTTGPSWGKLEKLQAA